MQREFNDGEQIQSIDFQRKPGFFDNEFARVDHVHDISAELYAKLGRDSDGNMIDNPEFIVSQRGFPAGSTPPVWQTDRWQLAGNGVVVANISSLTTGLPVAGIRHAARATVATADATMLTNDYLFFQQAIEGFVFSEANFGSSLAKNLVVSFWARSSIDGIFCCSLRNASSTRSHVKEFSLTANAWKLVILDFPGCTDGTWETTNNTGCVLNITMACGPIFQGAPNSWLTTNSISTANQTNFSAAINRTFDITGVKVETDNYSPFQARRLQTELLNCRRYLQVYQDPPLRGVVSSGTTITRCGMLFPVTFRAVPTLASVTGSAFLWDGTTGGTIATFAASYYSINSVEHDFNMAVGGFVTGRAACMYWNGGTSTWFYSAEI